MWFAVTLSDGAFSKSRLRVLGLRVDLQRKAEGDQLPDGDRGAVPQLPVHPTLRSAASAYHGWRAAGGNIVALRATDKVRTHDHHTDPGKHEAFNFQREKEEKEQKQCYERKLKLQIQASNSESITHPQPRDSSQCTNCPPAVPPATCSDTPQGQAGLWHACLCRWGRSERTSFPARKLLRQEETCHHRRLHALLFCNLD